MSTATSMLDARHVSNGVPALPAKILIVDDEVIIREILARKLSSLGYVCECCENGCEAIDRLTANEYDLLLADVMMPGIGGVALLKEALRIRSDIAVILVTSVVDLELVVDSLKHGAYDYITKPFSLEDVSISVSRALEKRRLVIENRIYQRTLEEQVAYRTQQLKEALDILQNTYHSTLMALGTALDSRDADTAGHSLRVTLYTTRLVRCLGLREHDLRPIQQGAALHDIGKIGVPDDLLRKPGKLSEDEWVLMRKHPLIGYRILSGSKFLQGAAQLVLHHHERYDGTGYPAGLSGDGISLGARVFSVADTLDCMTSNRPFRLATSFETARDEIVRFSGTQFDPKIVEAFLSLPLEEWKSLRGDATSRA
ncbi:MAG TPA: HD domain-containing phosphohydrolase [Acidobacteriota bacterium]|nr:HD domain-containing phosphohydrolase [Acidobacteriota bacterium]